jgi:hypothetical protein
MTAQVSADCHRKSKACDWNLALKEADAQTTRTARAGEGHNLNLLDKRAGHSMKVIRLFWSKRKSTLTKMFETLDCDISSGFEYICRS